METRARVDTRFYEIAGITIRVESDLPITVKTLAGSLSNFAVTGPGADVVTIRHHFGLPDLRAEDMSRGVCRRPPWAVHRRADSWLYLGIAPDAGDPALHRVAVFSLDHSSGDIHSSEFHEEAWRSGGLTSLTMFPTDQILLARILAERLSPWEIVAVEQADRERSGALRRGCEDGGLIRPDLERRQCDHLFHCGVGNGGFAVGYDGTFRLCSALWHPDTICDLRRGTLRAAWEEWAPRVRDLRASNPEFLERCRRCSLVNLCLWCPAYAALETGAMDEWVEYSCQVAHARAASLQGESMRTGAEERVGLEWSE